MTATRAPRLFAASLGVLMAIAAVGCGATSSSTPVLTIPPLDLPSLVPAREAVAPPSLELPPGLPSVQPPSEPPPPPEVTVDYAGTPDDLGAFVDAYRAAFGLPSAPETDIATAGARLCTYLQRHADAGGTVDLDAAVTEADINEPGYPRAAWLLGFEIATASYCTELAVAVPAG